MTIGAEPICMSCKNYIDDPLADGFKCAAYPDGIPDEIIFGGIDHHKRYKGDNGVVYQSRDEAQDINELRSRILDS